LVRFFLERFVPHDVFGWGLDENVDGDVLFIARHGYLTIEAIRFCRPDPNRSKDIIPTPEFQDRLDSVRVRARLHIQLSLNRPVLGLQYGD
jgi:hypothetical protein